MGIVAGFLLPHPPVMVPDVGRGREAEVAATTNSMRRIAAQIAGLEPETIVIFSPHSAMYADYIHISPGEKASGSLKNFGSSALFRVAYDDDFTSALKDRCAEEGFPAGTLGERDKELDHGTLVPLHFINEQNSGYRLIRVSASGLSREEHYRFGMLLAQTAEELGRKTVVIASGDLSHRLTRDGPYGFAPEGQVLDAALTSIMRTGDFKKLFELDEELTLKGAECGFRPFLMLAGTLDAKAVNSRLLSYEGPFGVGYAVASFIPGPPAPHRNFLEKRMQKNMDEIQNLRAAESSYVRLARESLEAYVKTGKLPPLSGDSLPEELRNQKAGTFVSIKKRGQLRGCIGTTAPAQINLAEEIRQNAISSGTRDTRFNPIEPHELDELVYSVDILLPAQPAAADMLDPKRYGVIVTSGHKRGLLLPNLDGVDTAEQQLSIALQKAGISGGQAYDIERFEVVRHH